MRVFVYVCFGIILFAFSFLSVGNLLSNSSIFVHNVEAFLLVLILPVPFISFYLSVLFDIIYKVQPFRFSRFIFIYVITICLVAILITIGSFVIISFSESLIWHIPSNILWNYWIQLFFFFIFMISIPVIIGGIYVLIRPQIFNADLLKFFIGYIIIILPVSMMYVKFLK